MATVNHFEERSYLSLKDMAWVLTEEGLPIGRQRLIEALRSKGIFQLHSPLPFMSYVDRGYFSVHKFDNGNVSGFTTKVTGRGQSWLINRVFKLEIKEALDVS